MIHVRDLTYRFGERVALRGVSFSVEKGGFVFLMGPSGSGKTTLLRVLHGALRVQEGRAGVAGFDLARMRRGTLYKLRREVAVIFQDFKILDDWTVYENVALPLRVRGVSAFQVARRVREVLDSLGLGGDAKRPCRTLAGGEQQRVAIARAVAAAPKLLLADEPTGNLDAALGLQLLDVLRQVNAHGTTILMATHNRDLVAAAPEAGVVRLADGVLDQGEAAP